MIIIKKKIILFAIIPIVLIAAFAFWNIKIIVNMQIIGQLKNDYNLYEALSEYVISEDISNDPSFSTVTYKEIEFKHTLGQGIPVPEREFFVMEFDEQKTIAISPKKKTDSESSLYEQLNNEAKQIIAESYGQDTVKNEFNLRKKAWEVSPDDLSWFSFSKKKVIANMFLLLIKSDIPSNVRAFEFKTNNTQGFIFEMSRDKSNILLQVFDTNERAATNYDIYMQGAYTKSEIDTILKTMKFFMPKED